MALDPQARAVLELIIKSGRPPYHQLSPKEARQLFRETRPASTPVPPEIGVVRNVLAEGRHAAVPLRVYRPAGVAATTLLPGLVYFHGGGWVIGDLDTHDVLCRQLTAEAGITVASVDYRLAPEHKFPAAVDDAWEATRWVASVADLLGCDEHFNMSRCYDTIATMKRQRLAGADFFPAWDAVNRRLLVSRDAVNTRLRDVSSGGISQPHH